jgi:hypothetical protein
VTTRIIRDYELRSEVSVTDVGARRYACDPSTEILCVAYRVKHDATWGPVKVAIGAGGEEGRGAIEDRLRVNLWAVVTWDEYFHDFLHSDVVAAHNNGFEAAIEDYLLPDVARMRGQKWESCTAARARRLSLPGSLADACRVLRTPHQKSEAGHGVMLQCSQPRPTWTNRQSGRKWFDDAERLGKTAIYCCEDILAECDLDDYLPELPPTERAYWLHTELVNRRGVPLDVPLIDAMSAAVAHEQQTSLATIRAATGDPEFTLTNPAAIITFCKTRGLWLTDLRKETVERTLRDHDDGTKRIDEVAKLVLEARRDTGGKTSISKLPRMRSRVMSDGRSRDNVIYHGAHTGRNTGDGINVLNLPRPYKKFDQARVIECVRRGDLRILQHEQGVSASTAVSAALRGVVWPGPGRKLVVGDYSSVEPCFSFTLAEQWDAVEILRRRQSLYIDFGRTIYGRELDKKADLREYTICKETILGCFGPETKVLTKLGPKSITDITSEDQLWDGVEWVKSKGAMTRGLRSVMSVVGLSVTPDHLVLCGTRWVPAFMLGKSIVKKCALATGSENWSSPAYGSARETALLGFMLNATAGQMNTRSTRGTFTQGVQRLVQSVLSKRASILGNVTRAMQKYAPTTNYEKCCLIEYPPFSSDATIPTTEITNTTAGAELKSVKNFKIDECFSRILSRCRVTTTVRSNLIEKTITKAMNGVICGLLLAEKIWPTDATPLCCSEKLMTYDVAYAGPRNRYAVVSDAGLLIVHNCGYGMGKLKFHNNLVNKGVAVSEDESGVAHSAYRQRFVGISSAWKGLEGAAKAAIREPGAWFQFNSVHYVFDGYWLVCTLPSGRPFYYPNACLQPGKYDDEIVYEGWMRIDGRPAGWGDVRTWGGSLLENVTQAACRDILEEDQLVVEQQPGWEVILTVYDEIVASVPVEDTNAVATMKAIMERPRPWMPHMPVLAEVFEADRYVKH